MFHIGNYSMNQPPLSPILKVSTTPNERMDQKSSNESTASTATATPISLHTINVCQDYVPKDPCLSPHIKENPSNILTRNDFKIIKPLTKGQYGKIYIAQCTLNQQIYCMKIQSQHELEVDADRVSYEHERTILGYRHPRFPGLFASFQDGDDHVLVMDYCYGGDLFSLLDRQPTLCLTEPQAQFYMAEMVLACESLHQLNYVHRDIKPQNILLDHRGHVKLADFGSCLPISQCTQSIQLIPVGTCDYVAPEVLLFNQYGTKVDCWSLGICLYEMLQELPPFYSDISENDTYRKIIFHEGPVSFNPHLPISDNAKDLINKLLTKAEYRLTLDQVKAHAFFDGVDWDSIFESKAPFCPTIQNLDDTTNFSIPLDTIPPNSPPSHPLTPPSSPYLFTKF